MFQNLGYPEGFLYLKGQKSRIVHGVQKGWGAILIVNIFFSQGHPHQVRKNQEIPGWDRHISFL